MSATWRIAPEWAESLAAAGIDSVATILARSECIRDLPDRSNHVAEIGALRLHVKRHRHGRWRKLPRSPEALGHEALTRAGVRTAPLVLEGVSRGEGAVAGTLDLAPARPVDDLLRDGALVGRTRRAVLHDLARQIALLHDANVHHRDLYLNHVFVDPAAWPPKVRLIDTERVGSHRARVAGRWVVKDLAQLRSSVPPGSVSRAEMHRFLLVYLASRGVSADAWREPLVQAIAVKVGRMARHRPRTPVGDAARPEA